MSVTIVPLGFNCVTCTYLCFHGLSNQSLPFDWIGSTLDMTLATLKDDFRQFLRPSDLTGQKVVHNKYGQVLPHLYEEKDEASIILERVERRTQRFRQLLTGTTPLLFFSYFQNGILTLEGIKEFCQYISTTYPLLSYYYIGINNSPTDVPSDQSTEKYRVVSGLYPTTLSNVMSPETELLTQQLLAFASAKLGVELPSYPPRRLMSGNLLPVKVFYTIATDYPQAFPIFQEQMALLQESGLAKYMNTLTIMVAGNTPVEIDNLPFKEKIILLQAPSIKEGELHTHFEILRQAQTEEFYALYFHSKGCTHPIDALHIQDWRLLMEHFLIREWKQVLEDLHQNDTVGVNQSTWPFPHYSGNFWWARSTYIKHLPNPFDTFLSFYTDHASENQSRQHQHMLEEQGFDPEFVRLTYPPEVNLPIKINLTAFIREYGFDWLWYTRHNPEAHGLNAQQAIDHWKKIGVVKKLDGNFRQYGETYKRFNGEAWIQHNGGKHYSRYNSNCKHYGIRFPPELYRMAKTRKRVAVFFIRGHHPCRTYTNTPEIEYRIFTNLLGNDAMQLRKNLFHHNQWNATFLTLETPSQLMAFERHLRRNPLFNEVIIESASGQTLTGDNSVVTRTWLQQEEVRSQKKTPTPAKQPIPPKQQIPSKQPVPKGPPKTEEERIVELLDHRLIHFRNLEKKLTGVKLQELRQNIAAIEAKRKSFA